MATYVLTIAGSTKKLQPGWSIRESANARAQLTGAIVSTDASYRPAIGAEVILTEDGTRIFGGYIDTPSEAGLGGEGVTGIVTSISAADYTSLAERRSVIDGGFTAGFTMLQCLNSLQGYLNDYGVTVDPAQATGPSLTADISYDVRTILSILDELAVIFSGISGDSYIWRISYDKKLRMFAVGDLTAPVSITTANRFAEGDVTPVKSRTEYANHIILLAGTGTDEVTDAFTGDGSTTDFPLTYRLFSHRGYVTNGGVDETLDTSGATWIYNPATNTISRTPAPANLNAISITYIAQFPLRVESDGGAAPADLVEKVLLAPETFDAEIAQALADGYLLRAMAAETQTVTYRTRQLGIHAGQTQTITVAGRNISGSFLITDVTTVAIQNVVFRDVIAVSGDQYPGSWRDDFRQESSSGVTVGGTVSITSGGGVGGIGTPGSLAQWATAATLEDATAVPAGLLTGTITSSVQDNITRLGTIVSGVWNAGAVTSSGVIRSTSTNGWAIGSVAGVARLQQTTGSFSLLNASDALTHLSLGSVSTTGAATFDGNTGSSTYVSQTTGWRVTAAGEADFRYLFVDEMHAKSFIADLEQALAGGQIIAKSVAMVATAFSMPATGGSVTFRIRDLPSAPNMAAFETGDRVIFRTFSRSAGALTIADAIGFVDTYVDGTGADEGTQTWGFNRDSGTNGGTMATSTTIPVDSIVLDMGVSGNGYYEVNAIDGTYGVNSPYAQIVTWTTTPAVANRVVRARYGNLKGITGSTEYGLWAGKSLSGNQYLLASDTNFELRGIDLKLYDGGTNTVRIDPSVPSFAMGSTLPSAYGTGTGIWMGKDSGAYKFRVGNPSSGIQMTWNGTALVIGGFTFGASTIDSGGGVNVDGAGLVHVGGASSSAFRISTLGGAPHRAWVGDATASVDIWYVAPNGFMYADAGILLGTGGSEAGSLTFSETGSTPATPSDGAGCRVYMKADKLIVQYNDGGTVRYYYLDLPSASGTWAHTTSAP